MFHNIYYDKQPAHVRTLQRRLYDVCVYIWNTYLFEHLKSLFTETDYSILVIFRHHGFMLCTEEYN